MKRLLVVLLMMSWAAACFAQENNATKPQEPAVYKFEFTAYELQNAKRTNVRNYSMMLKEDTRGEVRTGNRIPVQAKEGFQYMDVGLFITSKFTERNGTALLSVLFEMSSLVAPDAGPDTHLSTPVVRTFRQDAYALLIPGKPLVVASIDDVGSPRTVQLEVTATKMK
ncbi:MAG: hypothetical protein JWO13_2768 [Acidobacteriales bacterium]|nr:hypothetical protein [Terriglobales bacterium]